MVTSTVHVLKIKMHHTSNVRNYAIKILYTRLHDLRGENVHLKIYSLSVRMNRTPKIIKTIKRKGFEKVSVTDYDLSPGNDDDKMKRKTTTDFNHKKTRYLIPLASP